MGLFAAGTVQSLIRAGLTVPTFPLIMGKLAFSVRRPAAALAGTAARLPVYALVAPSFNGRTAASGAAYRGSNPWGATKNPIHSLRFSTFLDVSILGSTFLDQ